MPLLTTEEVYNGKRLITGGTEAVPGGAEDRGVLLSLPKEKPLDPVAYRLLCRKKVLQVLENALRGREDYLEEFDTYLTEASNHPEIIWLA